VKSNDWVSYSSPVQKANQSTYQSPQRKQLPNLNYTTPKEGSMMSRRKQLIDLTEIISDKSQELQYKAVMNQDKKVSDGKKESNY
jgi:hypothetical protein